ncbi:hypothetical protein RUM43_012805 [Polyplax serrata]|uniref:Uncharacterized protein n=1 Tax=Polyplax serrata TaxID=468196 RepID=A0AAN8P5L7_POLSC
MDTVIYSESWRIVNQKREKPQSMKAPLEKPQGNHVHLAQADSTSSVSPEERELLLKKLQGRVKELRHKLKILEESVDSKDYSLGTIAREKDRAVGEIRRLEKSNKQLRQQLNDERNHYLEEKEKFCEEMTKCKKRLQEVKPMPVEGKKETSKWNLPISQHSLIWHLNKEKGDFADQRGILRLKSSKSQKLSHEPKERVNTPCMSYSDSQLQKSPSVESLHLYEGKDLSLQMAALKTENAKLRSIICERDERNYELCLRFLRMKHCKNDIRTRFQDLENEYLQVITNLMEKIDEARQEFNFIIDQKFKKPLHSTNAMYLRLVQRNSRMAFENASLRLENQCLKKELKKHLYGVTNIDRKIDETQATVLQDLRTTYDESKGEDKLKRIKKNVNFNEIQTIYQRHLGPKNSDTDSNYMSKTSTTAPSNTSLTDPKESLRGNPQETQEVTTFQGNELPNEILKKIFKRVDTSSCQTLASCTNSKDSKREYSEKRFEGTQKPQQLFLRKGSDKMLEGGSISNSSDSMIPDEIRLVDVNQRHRTDSSTPGGSKESIRFNRKAMHNLTAHTSSEFVKLSDRIGGLDSIEREAYLRIRKKEESLRGIRPRYRESISLDIDQESSVRWFDYSSRVMLPRENNVTVNDDTTRVPVRDSCGLEEKIDTSYQELPSSVGLKTSLKAFGETNPNLVNQEVKRKLKDEFNKGSLTDDTGSDRETRLLTTKTCRIGEDGMTVYEDNRTRVKESANNAEGDAQKPNTISPKRSEGSNRFSHRLISTSPEQLKNILTDSQLEAYYKMAPILVGQTMVDTKQGFQTIQTNNEIVLQFVISGAQSAQIFSSTETVERKTLEKETSVSGLTDPLPEQQPSHQAEASPSGIGLPLSNLPTSTSTMDVVDMDALQDRGNIILRTLSAPGLLESSWLDPYTVCEMRDCGTNT